MFSPTGGIDIAGEAHNRIRAGKNSQGLFPLNLKSAMNRAFFS